MSLASQHDTLPPAPGPRAQAPVWIAFGTAALWFAAHAAAPLGPPRSTWGLLMWEAWPPAVRWGAACVFTILALPPLVHQWTARISAALAPLAGRDLSRSIRAGLAVVFTILCWIGRSGNVYYGDGIVIAKIARTQEALLHYSGWSGGRATAEQVVEFCIHRGVNALLGERFGLEAYDTIALTHAVCGGVLVWLLTALFIAWWPGNGRRQLTALGLFLTLGVVQLWFGHVETYTIASTAAVGFLWAGTRALKGDAGLWQPALWAAAAMTVHTVFGGLLLGLAWVWWVRGRDDSAGRRAAAAIWLGVPIAVTAVAVVLTYRGLGFSMDMIYDFANRGEFEGATFVPLRETSNVMERYTFLSGAHLVDLLNECLLTGTYALALLAGVLAAKRARPFQGDPVPLFLVAGTLVYLVVIIVINPPGGGRKDWDVFAPPAIGYGLLAIYLLFATVGNTGTRRAVAGICLLAGAAHTVPWIVANARIDLPAHIEYYAAGKRADANGLRETALLEYRQALAILPTPELATRCGDLARATGDHTAALDYYRRAVVWENRSELAAFGPWEHALVAMGEIYEARGDHPRAEAAFTEAIRVAQGRHSGVRATAGAHAGLAHAAERAGRRGEACTHYRAAIAIAPDTAAYRTAAARTCAEEAGT